METVHLRVSPNSDKTMCKTTIGKKVPETLIWQVTCIPCMSVVHERLHQHINALKKDLTRIEKHIEIVKKEKGLEENGSSDG